MRHDQRKEADQEFAGQEVYVVDTTTGEVRKVIDHLGREILDGTPVAPPVGYKRQPSMVEHIRDMVRSERLKAEAEAAGHESFEDADNFEIADEEGEMPSSPHENEFDPPISELLQAGNEVVMEKQKSAVVKEDSSANVIPEADDGPQEKEDGRQSDEGRSDRKGVGDAKKRSKGSA